MAELLVDWDAPQTPVLRGHLKLGGRALTTESSR